MSPWIIAVCARICLPAKAHLRLELAGGGSAEEAGLVRAALSGVPQPRALGGSGPLRIDALHHVGPSDIQVEATTPDGTGALFVDAPDGWFFKISPTKTEVAGRLGFIVRALEHPAGPPDPAGRLRLTLVSPAGAIEVPVPLDDFVAPGPPAHLDAPQPSP